MTRSLLELARNRVSPEALLGDLLNKSPGASREAGEKLLMQASSYGLGLRDFLTLAIDANAAEDKTRYADDEGKLVNGYTAALAYLNLPFKNDFERGIVMEAAAETFQTYPGTRAMFPEVIDDMVKWSYKQDQLERIEPLIGSSRTINGVQMISTVVDDAQADYSHTQKVSEGARFPTRSIRTSQNTVEIWKHGSALRTTYEFERRAGIDLLKPYAARIARELEISKVGVATSLLINGDGVNSAATEVNQTAYVTGATTGSLNRTALLMWFVDRARAGYAIDTVVGDWNAYLQWLLLFTPSTTANRSEADNLAGSGFSIGQPTLLSGSINFAVSSTMTAGKILGMSKADTLEELVEANSSISENERSVQNQTVTYTLSQNVGYRIVWPNTRQVFDYSE